MSGAAAGRSGDHGSGPACPPEAQQQKILAEARLVWDREFHVSHLPDKLESIFEARGRG